MTYGQLFTKANPDVKVVENGACVWLYFDNVNHDTLRKEWWNTEINNWISVKDRMPEEDVYVLAHNGVAPFIAAYTTNPSKHWYQISGFTICPTHWMPLPEPPKEET